MAIFWPSSQTYAAPYGLRAGLLLLLAAAGLVARSSYHSCWLYWLLQHGAPRLSGIPLSNVSYECRKSNPPIPWTWFCRDIACLLLFPAPRGRPSPLCCSTVKIDIRVSEYAPIHATSVDGSLVKIGLLPLADGYGDDRSEAEGGCGTKGCISFNSKVCFVFLM